MFFVLTKEPVVLVVIHRLATRHCISRSKTSVSQISVPVSTRYQFRAMVFRVRPNEEGGTDSQHFVLSRVFEALFGLQVGITLSELTGNKTNFELVHAHTHTHNI